MSDESTLFGKINPFYSKKKKKKGLLMSAITHDSSSKSKSCWPLIKKILTLL